GLPDARVEAWKYTNLRQLSQRVLRRGDADAPSRDVDSKLLELPGVEHSRIVFVNGALRRDLSCFPQAGALSVASLASVLTDDAESVKPPLTREYVEPESAFAQLNTALSGSGIVIRVAANSTVPEPLHLVFVGASAEHDLAWSTRVIVELGTAARLQLIEHHVGIDHAHLGNVVSQLVIGDNAQLDLIQIQNGAEASTLIRRTEASIASNAAMNVHTLELGGQLVRHDLAINLDGNAARLTSRGVFALRGRQHVDSHLDIRHHARDTTCELLWRGVIDERARGVFHGAITIERGADGSDAMLSNKNLLLSAQAEIDTQPVLVIHADEVKAAHGATVGQLDDHALFYMRSRGIPEAEARAMLTMAFCRAALDSINNPALLDALTVMLIERLPVTQP
ncbi:MAG: Fe-S cluster assembly protein SufD, partial [Dokdonella sp.]